MQIVKCKDQKVARKRIYVKWDDISKVGICGFQKSVDVSIEMENAPMGHLFTLYLVQGQFGTWKLVIGG